ncbi:tRNA 5-hydroxyuridine modification protein YegQ [Marinicella rhabdoformis]|uniref:prephenate-dependent tRNA uridine(34) hydroxylase TrhP n=1 Tax=Marinicella rhabdoformis TaxID=2580566 RepID=UPI0012AEDBA7|nr:tRNA 5-hydroxyuridine modification protein YegQ [Marinicella rhabdoformis]
MKATELLSPAGSLKNMRYAFAYGADAVYAGQPRYSLRVRNNEFNLENLAIGIDEAHQLNKQFYVVSNIAPHNSKLKTYLRDIDPVIKLRPDALIMSDPGLIMMVREQYPDMPIHLSVQANAVNWATVKFWQNQGIERVILSRELSLDEIEEIRFKVPDMELEVFVHGALCMAYSGRCLLSGYINKRDPNQGTCTNACRWQYDVHPAKQNQHGDVIPLPRALGADEMVLLQEKGRPDDYLPTDEDEHGTYIMNSKDLMAVACVERLVKMGVHSLKIEGRTKSHYYCARTAQVYRKAINDAVNDKPLDVSLSTQLSHLAHRGYTEGFLRRHNHQQTQNYEQGHSSSITQQFVGEVIAAKGKRMTVAVKNKFVVGNDLEVMTTQGNFTFRLTEMYDKNGAIIDDAKGSGHVVDIVLPQAIETPELALIMRFNSQ